MFLTILFYVFLFWLGNVIYHSWITAKYLKKYNEKLTISNDEKSRYTNNNKKDKVNVDDGTNGGAIITENKIKEYCNTLMKNGNKDEGFIPYDSKILSINSESAVFLSSGRASTLQLAHPIISLGVMEHSKLNKNKNNNSNSNKKNLKSLSQIMKVRFHNTFKVVFPITFGDQLEAVKKALFVYKLHRRVKGKFKKNIGKYKIDDEYAANDVQASLWVASTLVESTIFAYQLVFGELSKKELNECYESFKPFGYAFGISYEDWPSTFDEFMEYYVNFLNNDDEIAISEECVLLCQSVSSTQNILHTPIAYLIRVGSFMLMPSTLRTKFIKKCNSLAASSPSIEMSCDITKLDYLIGLLSLGNIRFIYRLIPKIFRILNPYSRLLQRHYYSSKINDKNLTFFTKMKYNFILFSLQKIDLLKNYAAQYLVKIAMGDFF